MIETSVTVVDGREYWSATKDGKSGHGRTEKQAVNNLLAGRTDDEVTDAVAGTIILNHDEMAAHLIDCYRSSHKAHSLLGE